MKILIDINHPAHIHLFKNFTWIMNKKGHKIFFTVRDKEHEVHLLNHYKFNYISFGKHYSSYVGKIFGMIKFDILLFYYSLRFLPDIYLSHGSIYASHVAWLLGKPNIALEDTGNLEQIKLYRFFTKVILTPETLPKELGIKQVKYSSNHEIAYLHKKYYNPNKEIYKYLGINQDQKFCLIRFVSWNATHDKKHKGLTLQQKISIVNYLSDKLRIFISSESKLSKELSQYAISIPPERMHDVLYFAQFYIGEGATMASEAGILGTPAIYINSQIASNCEELANYGIIFNFRDFTGVIEKISELLNKNDFKKYCRAQSGHFIQNKIDITELLVWFVEKYPESFEIMRRNPTYQLNFK